MSNFLNRVGYHTMTKAAGVAFAAESAAIRREAVDQYILEQAQPATHSVDIP